MLTAVVGVNWGDEGKGRMVDLLSADHRVIVRYQGGNNAGHTVINDRGSFILNLLPSGVLRRDTVNVLGPGMVIDLEHLCGEIEKLEKKGIDITPERLKISDRAVICLPYHVRQDIAEEERLADKPFGSTRRGIAPVYGDKYLKKAVRMDDLLSREALWEKMSAIVEWKNLTIQGGYHKEPITPDAVRAWLSTYGQKLTPYICDVTEFLSEKAEAGEDILFEAQLGALRDIEYGIYPYTTSSQTLASYATTGGGLPGARLDNVVGIMKAYSSCVGEGPFTVEMFGPEGDALREAGYEYGAATGRPRRVGAFDVVASRYGAAVQGADALALTKLDVLSYMDRIPVCVAYQVDGQTVENFPLGQRLVRAQPVYEYLDGFGQDISGCRRMEDLPAAARAYVRYVEKAVRRPVRYISVGPDREAYIDAQKG